MPSEAEEYLNRWTRVMNSYLDGDLRESLGLTEEMMKRFPGRRSSILHAQACLLVAANEPERAIHVVEAAAAEGIWWSPQELADPDLDPLRRDPSFLAAAARMGELRERSATGWRSEPAVEVFVPEGEPAALLVVLHMYGMSGPETSGYWRAAAEQDVVVAVPESTQLNSDGMPCWDDPQRARNDLDLAIERATGEAAAGMPVILGGASQGAGVAMREAISGGIGGIQGFIAVVGAADAEHLEHAPAGEARIKGVMIGGEQDRLVLQHQRKMRDLLEQRGYGVRLEEVPGLRHWYPSGFASLLAEALRFILAH